MTVCPEVPGPDTLTTGPIITKDNAIDQQVHLGMDIASTSRADVRAANKGKVVFADYLGIYGNMVLVDHGQGVFSLYSHLSQINVGPGDDG